ncbi:substrate-binding domain-containing protein [Streptomyces niveus]|uniref:substrate-binding domain-containing protein n=1 Tax=Streptomyces niveus TaxID=193462 RepID=UPI0009906489|nr:substrate-binding domain-containing protein [Streptomyces niveus]
MERHSLPDDEATDSTRGRRPRRRTVLIATALVLSVAAGTGVAAQSGLLSFADGCTGSAVRIDLAASPDIAPAVRAVADDARRNNVTSDGRCVDVRVDARENYEIADGLATGTSAPDYEVWLPDSDVWVERALDAGDGVALTPAGNAATTPVTLAAVPSVGKRLGWPEKTYTWAELTATAAGKDALRLGAADPARSATGLLAFSSVVGSTREEDPDSDTRIAATAEALAERVSESDGQVVRSLVRGASGNARGNEAVFLTEQAAFVHNSADDGGSDLQLFYPTDAAPVLNYPLNLVNEPDLTTEESRAAMRFISLLSEDGPQRTMAEHGFRTGHSVVPGGLVRTAGGRAPQPFALTNAQPPASDMVDETLGMWTVTVQDARLTVVVDTSNSMAGPVPERGGESRMDVTKTSMLQTLARFTPADEVGLWGFAAGLDGAKDFRKLSETAPLGERAKDGATHRESLSDAVSALAPVATGSAAATGMYDTTLAAFKEAQSSYVSGKCNAVIILTGGPDTDTTARTSLMTELRKLADPRRPVPLIAIAVGPEANREEMDEVARITGGAGYEVSDPAEIQAVMIEAIMSVGGTKR